MIFKSVSELKISHNYCCIFIYLFVAVLSAWTLKHFTAIAGLLFKGAGIYLFIYFLQDPEQLCSSAEDQPGFGGQDAQDGKRLSAEVQLDPVVLSFLSVGKSFSMYLLQCSHTQKRKGKKTTSLQARLASTFTAFWLTERPRRHSAGVSLADLVLLLLLQFFITVRRKI